MLRYYQFNATFFKFLYSEREISTYVIGGISAQKTTRISLSGWFITGDGTPKQDIIVVCPVKHISDSLMETSHNTKLPYFRDDGSKEQWAKLGAFRVKTVDVAQVLFTTKSVVVKKSLDALGDETASTLNSLLNEKMGIILKVTGEPLPGTGYSYILSKDLKWGEKE